MPELHPELAGLAFLLGTWEGSGRGDYPTVDAFSYDERISFAHAGKPFLSYQQRTWDPDGEPLHSEAGYLRPAGPRGAELVLCQPTGITEVHTGVITDMSIHFETTSVGRTPTAKEASMVVRRLRVAGDELSYRLDMAAVGQDLQYHLEAVLTRVGGNASGVGNPSGS